MGKAHLTYSCGSKIFGETMVARCYLVVCSMLIVSAVALSPNTTNIEKQETSVDLFSCYCETYEAGAFTKSDLSGCGGENVCPMCTSEDNTVCKCVQSDFCIEVDGSELSVIAVVLIILIIGCICLSVGLCLIRFCNFNMCDLCDLY